MNEFAYYLAGFAIVVGIFLGLVGTALLWEKYPRATPIILVIIVILSLSVIVGDALMEAGG